MNHTFIQWLSRFLCFSLPFFPNNSWHRIYNFVLLDLLSLRPLEVRLTRMKLPKSCRKKNKIIKNRSLLSDKAFFGWKSYIYSLKYLSFLSEKKLVDLKIPDHRWISRLWVVAVLHIVIEMISDCSMWMQTQKDCYICPY